LFIFLLDVTTTQAQSKTKDKVADDAVLCRAVIRSLEIIDKANRKLDGEFRSIYTQIEWMKMTGSRDWGIHHYFVVY
jgi:uncharacterized protein with HEPN domain